MIIVNQTKMEVIFGPMFAGKTSKLIEMIKQKQSSEQQHTCLIIKPSMDTRYSNDELVSHNGEKIQAKSMKTLSINDLKYPHYSCLFIDEGHMFSDDIVEFCKEAIDLGIYTVVAGIDIKSNGDLFENMKQLIDLADEKHHLTGTCGVENCNGISLYSYLKSNDNPTGKIVVGGAELYMPVCDHHFREFVNY